MGFCFFENGGLITREFLEKFINANVKEIKL